MENLLKDLMSGETMGRLSAVEKTASKLANKSWLKDVPNDMKMKLMNASVNTVKDANPKIVVAGLNCLDLLIKNYKDDFSPMIAMSFDLLLAKLGDAKSVIREHALEVTLNLIGLMGMGSAFAVVTTHLNHKNQRVKESLLTIVSRLQTQHGLELRSVVSATSMCKAVAPLLNDSVGALRQLAVTTLAEMYPLYGEDIVDSLSAVEIRPAQEKLLLAAIYACKQKGHNQQQLQVAANSKHAAAAAADDDEVDPWSLLNDEEDGFSHPPQQANTSRLSPTGVPREREGFESSNGGNFSSRGDAGVSTSKPPMRRSLSATQRRPVSTHPSSSSAAVLSSTESHQFASTVGAHSTASSASFDTVPSVSDGAAREPTSCYDPSGFMGFIQLKQGLKPTEIVDDRDLQKLVSKIAADMGKKTDWEARTSALIALQKLALGNLRDFKNCVDVVKSMNDLISTQIIDLRSTVSKEACKAVAALAYTLRQQFCPLAELWWLQLVRVVVVKIQVISSSADRCIRVVVACCQDQRLLSMIMEACGNKNPPLRRLSLEYLALACASWRSDIIEKNVNAIKQVVRVAVADADSGARKTARQLYWVLHNTPALQSHMKGVFNDLEAAIQRHINAEATSDSPEMSDLFLIVQNPSCLLDYARTCSTTSTNSTTTSNNEGSVAEEAKPSVSSTMRGIADSKPARASSAKPAARAQAIHHTSSAAAAAAAAVAKPAPKGQQATEQDRVTDRHQEFDFASTASGAVASTVMKSSRRLSLTAGPVRLVGATTSAGGIGAVGSSWESGEAPGGVATKTPSASTAISSRRLSLQVHTMAPPGRSLTRSTDFSAADTCNSNNNNNSSSTEDLHMGATTLSVSSLLSIPHSSTSLATSSSFLSQGAVRNLDAKTPAVKASGIATGTRPSLFSAAHQAPSIDEEAELPSSSVSLAVSAESLKFDRYLHAEEEHSSHTISSTPAVPSTARINRRASLGAFPMTGSAAGALTSTAGTISGTSSSVSTGVSSLLNGPKRIIRAPQGQNAPEQPSSGTQIAAAGANTSAGDAGDMGRAVTQHAVAVTPAPSNQQRPSVLLCSQVGAHVATVADSALKAAVAAAEGEDRKKGDNGHAENGVFVFSGETLRTMVQDTQWSTRVKAFESINVRLQRAISTSEALNEGMIETFVDLCLPHLADPHHKVASDALQVLQSCIAAYPNFIKSRLGAILLALFHRLADRRSAIRDQANSILNLMRSTLDSVQIMGALSPRMGEVPDRMKTALMQFMGAIAPHCDEFFAQATNTWAFLSRMAHIISGSGGTKPSVTLTVAARRLLELVFKTTPVMMCSQIAALPFQQQIALKKFLEASVPDIDLQVMQASKAEWTGKSQAPLASKSVLTAEGLAMSMSAEMDTPQQLPPPPFAGAVSAQSMSDDNWEELESSFQTDRTAQSSVFELKTRPGMGGRDDRDDRSNALSEAVMPISASSHSRIVSDSDSVAVCGATAPPSSPPSVVSNTVTATATADAALFSPPPPPAPAATPPPASAASSPAVPMSFTPRNLSAAAIEAEVRTLEFIDACHHSRSPSENISPNSPDFQRKTPAPTVDSLGLTPKDKDAYTAELPAFATLDDPTISAVLASKRAIDLATEEIIQRYSPTKTPSPVLASAVSVVDIILDPTAELLHHALSSAYGDSHSSSTKAASATSSPTPTRPSQLPHHKSLIGSNSASKHDAVATQETQEAQQVVLGASQSSGPDAAVRLHNINSSSPVVKAASHKKVAPSDAAAATPSAAKPVLSSTAGLGTPPVSVRKTSAAPSAGKATTPPMPAARVAHKSPSPARAAPPGHVKKDTFWLLESLKPTAALPVREEASRELKLRIKTADDSYWLQNYAQIVTVLLESFRADARECPSSSSSSSSTIHAPTSNKRASTASSATLVGFEHMECSTKSLLLLMRYRGPHMKNLLEVLVDKLCRAAAFAPAPISQTLEGVLSELARHDALRLLKALLPYATFSSSCAAGNNSANSSSSGGGNDSSLDVGVAGSVGECPQVRLMALHVLCNAVRFLTSAQLLSELPTCVPAVLSSINSSLADLRKAVVFILVEMYLAVGDSVFPYVHSLTPPQRKLLTIYIEKRMNERKNIVAAAQQS